MENNFSGPVPTPSKQTSELNILITGASRGIGFELVKQYSLAYNDNIVIAAVRDPKSKSSKELTAFASNHNNVFIIPLDVSNEQSIRSSIKSIPSEVKSIDILYNNAGIMGTPTNTDNFNFNLFSEIFTVNTIAPIIVTEVYKSLLLNSKNNPKVINVSSGLGSSTLAGAVAQFNTIPYGASKSALNFINKSLATAIPEVTFLSISPGWVRTDMGGSFGTEAPVSVQDSAQGTRYVVQNINKQNSGQFIDVITQKPLEF